MEGRVRLLAVSNSKAKRSFCQIDEHQATIDFEDLLSEISRTFINLPSALVDNAINDCLERLADGFDIDRAMLTELDTLTEARIANYQWSRPGILRDTEIAEQDVGSQLVEIVRQGRMVVVPQTGKQIEPCERELLRSWGVKSTVVIPLVVDSKRSAALSLFTFHKNEGWNSISISRLQQAGYVFARALERKHTDETLQVAYSTISSLKRRLEQDSAFLQEETRLEHEHCGIVGHGDAMRSVLKKVEQVGPTDSAVLIFGETGTGKELIARRIHELSKRKSKAIIKVNCAAMPAALIESELFGREKGAYTGALSREIGRFELANDSTIFLDEIGEMPIELQAKLLRVLQDGEFERLGSSRTMRVNVRVIAATNRDLKAAIKEGRFREDLYYRLSVFPIEMPPLRERREDIPALVWYLLREQCSRMGREITSIHPATFRAFQEYSWPGNVRELRNVIERHLILNTGPVFRAEISELVETRQAVGQQLDEVERNHMHRVLQSTRWRIRGSGGAAEILGLKPTTLEARLKKLGVVRPG